jgi:Holliday junction resolvase RusA-like endonuclease
VAASFALPVEDATATRAGDVDKLGRNLLDALQDAGAYRDDVQVTRLLLDKTPAGERGPGVALRVWQ